MPENTDPLTCPNPDCNEPVGIYYHLRFDCPFCGVDWHPYPGDTDQPHDDPANDELRSER